MDPYDSPLRSPYGSAKNPFLHSLLRTRELCKEKEQETGTRTPPHQNGLLPEA